MLPSNETSLLEIVMRIKLGRHLSPQTLNSPGHALAPACLPRIFVEMALIRVSRGFGGDYLFTQMFKQLISIHSKVVYIYCHRFSACPSLKTQRTIGISLRPSLFWVLFLPVLSVCSYCELSRIQEVVIFFHKYFRGINTKTLSILGGWSGAQEEILTEKPEDQRSCDIVPLSLCCEGGGNS
jgi:hypothetical protein